MKIPRNFYSIYGVEHPDEALISIGAWAGASITTALFARKALGASAVHSIGGALGLLCTADALLARAIHHQVRHAHSARPAESKRWYAIEAISLAFCSFLALYVRQKIGTSWQTAILVSGGLHGVLLATHHRIDLAKASKSYRLALVVPRVEYGRQQQLLSRAIETADRMLPATGGHACHTAFEQEIASCKAAMARTATASHFTEDEFTQAATALERRYTRLSEKTTQIQQNVPGPWTAGAQQRFNTANDLLAQTLSTTSMILQNARPYMAADWRFLELQHEYSQIRAEQSHIVNSCPNASMLQLEESSELLESCAMRLNQMNSVTAAAANDRKCLTMMLATDLNSQSEASLSYWLRFLQSMQITDQDLLEAIDYVKTAVGVVQQYQDQLRDGILTEGEITWLAGNCCNVRYRLLVQLNRCFPAHPNFHTMRRQNTHPMYNPSFDRTGLVKLFPPGSGFDWQVWHQNHQADPYAKEPGGFEKEWPADLYWKLKQIMLKDHRLEAACFQPTCAEWQALPKEQRLREAQRWFKLNFSLLYHPDKIKEDEQGKKTFQAVNDAKDKLAIFLAPLDPNTTQVATPPEATPAPDVGPEMEKTPETTATTTSDTPSSSVNSDSTGSNISDASSDQEDGLDGLD